MRNYLAAVLILFTCSLSVAEDFKLDEIPPLTPIKLLVSKLNPNFHLLLARKKSGGNHYLIINDGGRIYSPKQKQHSMIYYDDGSADLYLESGERVLIPTTQQRENYLNISLGATIIYPDRAPTPLREVAVSDGELQRVGFSRFIAPPDNRQRPERHDEWADYRSLENIGSKVIVQIRLKERLEYDEQRKIEEDLKKLDGDKARFLEHGNQVLFDQSSMTLLVEPDALNLVRQQVPADAIESMSVFDAKQMGSGERRLSRFELNQNIVALSDKTSPLQARVETLRIVHQNSELLSGLSENEKILLMKGVLGTLGDIDQTHSLVQNFAMYEAAVQDFKSGKKGLEYSVSSFNSIRRSEGHPIRALVLDPFRRAGRQGYEILDRVNHPIARQIVVETGSAIHGSGLSLLQGRPSGINHSYFREWLDQLRENLALVDRLPRQPDFAALEGLELRMSFHSGGIFKNMGVSGEMSGLSRVARRPLYFTNRDTTERLPTILLGLPGNKEALKRELVQYIIEADKKAQKLLAWSKEASQRRDGYSRDRSFSVEGDDNLFKFIVGLTYVPSIAKYAVPNFSEVEYKRNVIEVLQQLLEIANTSLVNTGTYVSVLEASLAVIKDVEREYGLSGRKQPKLTQAAIQLQRIVHHKMIRGLNWMSHESSNANACAILLAPDPWQALRNNRRTEW